MMPDARARRMMPPTTSAIDLIHCSMAGSFALVLVDGANISNFPEIKKQKKARRKKSSGLRGFVCVLVIV
jgi:hypothetical protein